MSGRLLQSSELHSNALFHALGTFGTASALMWSVLSFLTSITLWITKIEHTNEAQWKFAVGMALLHCYL
jgi:hypothetical protein